MPGGKHHQYCLSPFFPPWDLLLLLSSLDIWSHENVAASMKAATGICMTALASLCRKQFNSFLSDGSSLDPFPTTIWNRCCGACSGTSSSVCGISQVFQASLHSLVCRHVGSYRPCLSWWDSTFSHLKFLKRLIDKNLLSCQSCGCSFSAHMRLSRETGIFQVKLWRLHGTEWWDCCTRI